MNKCRLCKKLNILCTRSARAARWARTRAPGTAAHRWCARPSPAAGPSWASSPGASAVPTTSPASTQGWPSSGTGSRPTKESLVEEKTKSEKVLAHDSYVFNNKLSQFIYALPWLEINNKKITDLWSFTFVMYSVMYCIVVDQEMQGVTKRCRLSLLTNSALVFEPKCGGSCGVTSNKYSCAHGAPITLDF